MRLLRTMLRRAMFALCAAALTVAAIPAVAQVQLAPVDLRLASDGTGAGPLAVRLEYPSAIADYRYPDGAPVALYLPGGFGGGDLDSGARLALRALDGFADFARRVGRGRRA